MSVPGTTLLVHDIVSADDARAAIEGIRRALLEEQRASKRVTGGRCKKLQCLGPNCRFSVRFKRHTASNAWVVADLHTSHSPTCVGTRELSLKPRHLAQHVAFATALQQHPTASRAQLAKALAKSTGLIITEELVKKAKAIAKHKLAANKTRSANACAWKSTVRNAPPRQETSASHRIYGEFQTLRAMSR